jgi:hypothetical protein
MSQNMREALRHGDDCPTVEILIEAMEHGAAGRPAIASHVEKCPACQTELAMFRGFEAGKVRADEREAVDSIVRRLRRETEPGPAVTFWPRILGWLTPVRMGGLALVAAAILLTVGLSTQWQTRRGVSDSLPESGVTRSAAIRGISPQGEVAAFPEQIRWEPVPGAVEYDVTLSEVDRNVIFHKTFTTPALEVPTDIRRIIVPGKTVLLLISARNAAGLEMARSGMIRIVVQHQ